MTGLAPTVRAFLDGQSTLTLACADELGPWAAAVTFVRSGPDLFFLSTAESRHSRAFARDPRAAGAVHGAAEGWRDIRGVQMEGRVDAIESPAERAKLLVLYLAKFPFARELLEGAAGAALRAKVRIYRFRPERTFWVDNSGGFGKRTEVR